MSVFGGKGLRRWRRTRQARLPWDELEAEAARQGCSPADIFFDRAGLGDPARMAVLDGGDVHETGAQRVPWRGLDPRPASRAG
jgi:hypothetical protein